MDAGSGVAHSLASHGLDWMSITHVAVTHFHADHVADLPTLIFAWKYGRLPARSSPLTIVGPAGTLKLMGALAAAFGDWVTDPGFPLSVVEMEPGGSLDLAAGTTLSAFKVPHTEESVAYSISAGGRRLVYTGDTGWSPALGEWGMDCDLLLCECSLPESMAIPTHLTPEQCGQLATMMKAGALVLTHFYPPIEALDVASVVREHYSGPVSVAADGESYDLEVLRC
jgi:ribonuclease BN (tRNA processing enzyme)